ncbi:MAG: NapC/NirT family cytochrome c, partial [Desulfovibrio sp.]|nr:NapC/NirT family cytochrome c [Desulfovibrio sp.]
MPNPSTNGKGTAAFTAFVAGIVVLFVASYSVKATDGAAFCASCHAMGEAAWTHRQSVHRQFDCNECHTPAALGAKLPFKAQTGLKDIVADLSTIPDLIHSSAKMKDV